MSLKIDFATFPTTYTTLYEDATGTYTTAALTDNAPNYDGLFVTGKISGRDACSTIFVPKAGYGDTNSITILSPDASNIRIYGTSFSVSGNTLTTSSNATGYAISTSGAFNGASGDRNQVRIIRVIGVKGFVKTN